MLTISQEAYNKRLCSSGSRATILPPNLCLLAMPQVDILACVQFIVHLINLLGFKTAWTLVSELLLWVFSVPI